MKFSFIVLSFIPLFFLPITQDFYDTSKWLLLTLTTIGLLTVTLIIATWKTKHVTLTFSLVSLGLCCITISSLLSLIFASQNKIDALVNPFGLITFFTLTLISLFLPSLGDNNTIGLRKALYIATSLLGLIAVYQYFGMGIVMFPTVSYLVDPLFTPTGSPIATITLLVVILPLILRDAYTALKHDHEAHIVAGLLIMSIIIITGLGITLFQILPKLTTMFLPLSDGAMITWNILKDQKHMWMGIGAENFLTAFSSGRLPSYNLSPLWNIRFTNSTNLVLHLFTVYGIFGGISGLIFFKSFLKKSLILGFIALLFTPPNFTVLIFLVLLSLIFEGKNRKHMTIHLPKPLLIRLGLFVIIIGLLCYSLYGILRIYTAEFLFYQSHLAAKDTNGKSAYNLLDSAISQNPKITRFHVASSQTNLILASSLAGETTKDENRDLIAQLIQQSISEAKLAVSLNPTDILAWENLARVYSQLIGVAAGAESWAETSYKQAILLDPVNPILRLELGAIFVKKQQMKDAITLFQKSISLKRDYANAYFNLASAYKTSGDTSSAKATFIKTQSLVPVDSEDYRKITVELDNLK